MYCQKGEYTIRYINFIKSLSYRPELTSPLFDYSICINHLASIKDWETAVFSSHCSISPAGAGAYIGGNFI